MREQNDGLCPRCDGDAEVSEITVSTENKDDAVTRVMSFVEERLEGAGCPMKAQMQITVAVEEIIVNIASYAYAPGSGEASVRVATAKDPASVTITFVDGGKPFDPTAKPDPDVTLSAEERNIGGLGIFMTKKLMDEVRYEYKEKKNVLTMTKNF